MNGKSVYQITGTNITEETRLRRELEEDNLRLKAMNRRLRQYGQDVQEVDAGKGRSCAQRPAFTTRSATRCCRPGSSSPARRAT